MVSGKLDNRLPQQSIAVSILALCVEWLLSSQRTRHEAFVAHRRQTGNPEVHSVQLLTELGFHLALKRIELCLPGCLEVGGQLSHVLDCPLKLPKSSIHGLPPLVHRLSQNQLWHHKNEQAAASGVDENRRIIASERRVETHQIGVQNKMCDEAILHHYARYLKAGICTANFADDSDEVNVHGLMPTVWVEMGMLLLNLAVWLEAGARLAAAFHHAV